MFFWPWKKKKPKEEKKKEEDPSAMPGFPHTPHPLRGWTNFGLYEVHGINPRTGRSNKRKIEALNKANARQAALDAGLTEPITVTEIQRQMITERQAEYLTKLDVSYSGKETVVDASALISMVNDGENPQKCITEEQWDAACEAGVCISAWACQRLYRSCMRAAKKK